MPHSSLTPTSRGWWWELGDGGRGRRREGPFTQSTHVQTTARRDAQHSSVLRIKTIKTAPLHLLEREKEKSGERKTKLCFGVHPGDLIGKQALRHSLCANWA